MSISKKNTDGRSRRGLLRVGPVILVLVLVAGAGCDILSQQNTEDTRDAIRERVEMARQTWAEQDISTYQVTYDQRVGSVAASNIEVYVSGGEVDSVSSLGSIEEDDLLVTTIDSFFDLVLDRIGEEGSRFRADFDDEQGFPVSYNADFQDDRRNQDIITIALVDSVSGKQ
ncbi:DUF6174 domain-containing protein [Salinibacter sp.]|uniref:DUF6174 domain-containing protein n=1 Tax=Salinibacter sp. TaxID=2065818 RepID=UPI0021E72F9B|nr:DUF6174 domain-containing protein [Salinibacter sp.]